MSKTLSFAAALLGATLLTGAAYAQSDDSFVPKTAGTFMVRARVIDVLPENNSSKVTGAVTGRVTATNQYAPEVDFSYFLTNNIALELIAATTRHEVKAKLNPGIVDVGATGVLPPTLLVQYHFMPDQKFSPYVGAGLNYTFFYNSQPSNALGLVTRVSLQNNFGEALQIGFDYALTGRWGMNVDVKQIFLSTKASIDTGLIRAKTNLDPLVVGVGVSYKF